MDELMIFTFEAAKEIIDEGMSLIEKEVGEDKSLIMVLVRDSRSWCMYAVIYYREGDYLLEFLSPSMDEAEAYL